MTVEKYDDPIEVIFYSGLEELRPLKFKWNDRVIKVKSTNGYWNSYEGNKLYHFFAVSDESENYYELQCLDMKWKLIKMVFDV